MDQSHDSNLPQSPSLQVSSIPVAIRLRDRLFPILTMALAFIWAWSAIQVAAYVGSMNTARAIGAMMTAPMTTGSPMQSFPGTLFNVPLSPEPASQVQEQIKKQIATVEVVAYVWRGAMFVVAGSLAIMALFSAITGRVRLWQLLTACAILISTAGTLAGLWVLTRPDWGGMPPLPRLSYICTAAVQSAYAIVLLVAFARKPSFGRIVRITTVDYSVEKAETPE